MVKSGLGELILTKIKVKNLKLNNNPRENTEIETLQKKLELQSALAELGQYGIANNNLETFLGQVCEKVSQTLKIKYSKILEILANDSAFVLKAGTGWNNNIIGFITQGLGQNSLAEYSLHSPFPVVVEDLLIETRFKLSPILHNHKIISGVAVKIGTTQQPYGVLGVFSTQKRSFSQDELNFLQGISNIIASAVDRHKQQEKLRLFERAINASSNGIVITDALENHNPIIYVNPAFERITGYSEYEVLGKNCNFLQGQEQEQGNINKIRKALAEGKECHALLKNFRKNGQLFWNELHISPVYNEEKHLTHFIGVQTEVTGRLKAENALKLAQFCLDHALESVFLVKATGKIYYANHSAYNFLGYSREELLELNILKILIDFPVKKLFNLPEPHKQKIKIFETWQRKKNGELTKVEVSVNYIQFEGENYYYIFARDISERINNQEKLRKEKELLERITQTSLAAITVQDVQGKFIFANEKAEEVLGLNKLDMEKGLYNYFQWKVSDLEGQPLSPEKRAFSLVISTKKPIFDIQQIIELADGTKKYLSINGSPLFDANGSLTGAVLSFADITERKQLEQRLLHQALYDSLTDLPNRWYFRERLAQALKQIKRNPDYQFAVLFLDLDRFKVVNDSAGHLLGDKLLIAIARMLENCCGAKNTVARLGGDEFTILLEDIESQSEAITLAENIQEKLKKPVIIDNHEVFTSASIGIAFSSLGYDSPDEILRDADLTMYQAKQAGRATQAVFNQIIHTQLVQRLQLERDLHRALDYNELQVYYQPIISLKTQAICGFEALMRWLHPSLGFIPPDQFIPIAEETGLIVSLGEWILQEACKQLYTWQKKLKTKNMLTMSVNICGRQLKEKNLVSKIENILLNTHIDSQQLKLEITESMLMDDLEVTNNILKKLREKKIQLCIDDFGTGYSSLSYLHRFPVNTLKIDRCFVSRIGNGGEKAEIVQTIINLAHTLEMDLIAEGIETKEQLQFLQQLGCEQGQGYYISRPLDSRQMETFMLKLI